ncbi:MAG: CoA transferase [Chloroflexi bacterium]|nr:CoA transferase [Chloroflexota bacterium]
MPLALEGLRVIDVSQGVSGPLCAMQLGDLDADVIKLEPVGGDWLRAVGPFQGNESALFLQLNRNKRGIAVDLKQPDGRAVLERLLADADVLVEGYRPGVMERLGFDYASVSAYNPGIIYCSISGHGSHGPLADAPATELDIQAFVGANRHVGRADEPPLRLGYDLASTAAGMAGVQAIMAALFWRERSGEGQHVETSLLAAFIAQHQWPFSAEHSPDSWEGRPLTGLTDPPDHGFQAADSGALITLRGDEEGWNRFLIAINRPDVLLDPRFSTTESLMQNVNDLPAVVNDSLREWRYEDLRRLVQDELGGTIVPMNRADTLIEGEQMAALDMVRTIEGHPTAGAYRTLNVPWMFDDELASLRLPAPLLGQHTAEVLTSLGYIDAAIRQFAAAGVIKVSDS